MQGCLANLSAASRPRGLSAVIVGFVCAAVWTSVFLSCGLLSLEVDISMFRCCYKSLLGLACLALPFSAQAQAYNFSSAPVSHNFTQFTLGFQFSTNKAITVDSLGYFDEGQDGFLTPHEVGIFDASGKLLTSTLLSAGMVETLDGKFRYKDITPLTLSAGQTFTIAATTYGIQDGWAYGHQGAEITDFSVSPDIRIADDAARYVAKDTIGDNVLRLPVNQTGYTLYGGPNFKGGFAPASTPAPSALLTALIGIVPGVMLLRRRRK